jgi:hypothetical protein
MEDYGTIWVCQDCFLHHANGECGGCHESHDEEPLNLISGDFWVTAGMAWSEHSDDCRTERQVDSGSWHGCDCETDSYSTSACEGCGSWLHGERHAMTLLKS